MNCKCGKERSYRSRLSAARALVKMPKGREQRVYRCKYRRFHTTKSLAAF